ERLDVPPFGNVVDYLGYGGIYREVSLKIVDPIHIQDVFAKTSDVLNDDKKLTIELKTSYVTPNTTLDITLHDLNDNLIHEVVNYKLTENKISLTELVKGTQNWDIQNPHLYMLSCTIKENNMVKDIVTTRIGFREIAFKTDGFFLNGKKVKLSGLNRHQSFAHVGYAMPKSVQEKDATILKEELGLNIVRTSHYPQSVHFLNKCDEIGLLVFEEIPGWQHISDLAEWRTVVMENVKDMIIRDRNHPSIILWGVRINESGDCDDLYLETNKLAHELDDTRQTGGVRCIPGSNLLEDVYTYNDFVHRGNNEALAVVENITKSTDAPYLVTEYGGHMFPTKRFDHETRRVDHALIHARVLNHMYQDDRISGAIGWCMFDYNTHQDFGSGDKICYHGVLDMYRIPKIAAAVYSSQQDAYPVLEISSTMNIGEHSGGQLGDTYIFTNLDEVKFFRNDQYITTFTGKNEDFKHLPHPPIFIDDMIGDGLKVECFSESDAQIVKDILHYGMRNEANLSDEYKEKLAPILTKYNLVEDDYNAIYNKHIGTWGWKSLTYRFEGYKNGELIKTVTKGAVTKASLDIKIDSDVLVEDTTYDVTRVVCQAVCQNGNVLPYSNDGLSVSVSGPIELVGPSTLSLIGGARGFYLKSTGESGTAVVTINSESLGNYEFSVEVKKINQD
ncbi:MAG: glycoside hydrolase family 2 TIM barrel-domain containing protein, partial [Turicibacter sp.]